MNNKPTVVVPSDPKKREELIFALEYQIQNDVNEKDREIHKAALEKLKAAKQKKPAEKVGLFYFKSKFPELRSLAENGKTKTPLSNITPPHFCKCGLRQQKRGLEVHKAVNNKSA